MNMFFYVTLCFFLVILQLTDAQDSNRCWNQGLIQMRTDGSAEDGNAKTVEKCQMLCFNNTLCRGIDFDYDSNRCWMQFNANQTPVWASWNVTHFSLSDCTYLSRCWNEGLTNYHIDGGVGATGVTTEDECKKLCFNNSLCRGVDSNYGSGCWLQFNANTPVSGSNIIHWSLTNCTTTTTAPITTTSKTTTTTTATSTTTTPPTTTTSTSTTNNATAKVPTPVNPTVSETSTSSTVNAPSYAPNSTGTPNKEAIIGGVVGGVGGAILIGLIILLVVCIVRKRRREDKHHVKNIPNVEDASAPPLIGNNQKKPAIAPKPKSAQISQPMTLDALSRHFDKFKASESALKEEFQSLPTEKAESCTAAKKADGTVKRNRFKNVLPYDDSRVILPDENECDATDYINASYIQGYKHTPKSYIAAQGPLSSTLGEFWRMIWNENINRIVMLSQLVEMGKDRCQQYWPDGIDKSKAFDTKDLTVTLVDFQVCTDYTKRILRLQHKDENNRSETRQITQLQYRIWGDKTVPSEVYSLLEFRRKVRQLDKEATGPMLVHCSAGVGRTGTFIALDILLDQAENKEKISVFGVVEKLRLQRMLMVQVADQYKLLYRALLESPGAGPTNIARDRFSQTYGGAVGSDGFLRGPLKTKSEQEFRLLQDIKTNSDASADGQPGNSQKTKGKNTHKGESNYMYIYLSGSKTKSDSIAVRMNGYRFPSRFVLSPLPLADIANTFWKMIIDQRCPTVVLLEPPNDQATYLPTEEGSTLQHGSISVTLLSTIDSGAIRASDLLLQGDKSASMTVHLYQLTSWPNDQDPPENVTDILDLIALISTKHRQMINVDEDTTASSDQHPVTVVCRDGATRSGLYAAASYLIDKMNHDSEVDAYLSCRYVLSSRPEAIISLEQYQYLYRLAVESLTWTSNDQLKLLSRPDTTTVYANMDHLQGEQSIYANA